MTISVMSSTAQVFRFATVFGEMCLAWEGTTADPRVMRIFLPKDAVAVRVPSSPIIPPAVAELGARIQAFLAGEAPVFDLGILALDHCRDFQRQVLLAEAAIPRGWVSTYGRIAAHLGVPSASRAVGNALAQNPFPIAIPCHRAVRANGALGGYQGGLALKHSLLTTEGLTFDAQGRVLLTQVWY